MLCDFAIQAQNLGKAFAIFKKPEDRLKQMLWRHRRKYDETFWALEDVNISIACGETVGIIGRNGSGKSTLLQLLTGTLQPTTGELTINGRVGALLELGAGFNPEFTGRENIFLAATLCGLKEAEIYDRTASIIEFAGIGDFVEQPVKTYSSGMYARLAFAVMAHVEANILLIDEILAVGDVAFTFKCMNFIQAYKQRGTLLLVSHDTNAIIGLCDRVIWLDCGRVREEGSAKEICHNYLASFYNEIDDQAAFKIGGTRKRQSETTQRNTDIRSEIFKKSGVPTKVETENFDATAPWFGQRGASVEQVHFEGSEGELLAVLEGGWEVILRIECVAHRDLLKPIVGFVVKDRLGQPLFGDNTYLTFCNQSRVIPANSRFVGSFRFQFPYMASGDYAITASIAEGTQDQNIQHHWIEEALFFKVHSSPVSKGLIGIPMLDIRLDMDTAEHLITTSSQPKVKRQVG